MENTKLSYQYLTVKREMFIWTVILSRWNVELIKRINLLAYSLCCQSQRALRDDGITLVCLYWLGGRFSMVCLCDWVPFKASSLSDLEQMTNSVCCHLLYFVTSYDFPSSNHLTDFKIPSTLMVLWSVININNCIHICDSSSSMFSLYHSN